MLIKISRISQEGSDAKTNIKKNYNSADSEKNSLCTNTVNTHYFLQILKVREAGYQLAVCFMLLQPYHLMELITYGNHVIIHYKHAPMYCSPPKSQLHIVRCG